MPYTFEDCCNENDTKHEKIAKFAKKECYGNEDFASSLLLKSAIYFMAKSLIEQDVGQKETRSRINAAGLMMIMLLEDELKRIETDGSYRDA